MTEHLFTVQHQPVRRVVQGTAFQRDLLCLAKELTQIGRGPSNPRVRQLVRRQSHGQKLQNVTGRAQTDGQVG